jgi:CBS domain-containing protein
MCLKPGCHPPWGYGEKGQRAFLHTVRVKEIMSHPVMTVSPETAVADAAGLMLTHGIGCLPVVQNDQLVGIVTKTNRRPGFTA